MISIDSYIELLANRTHKSIIDQIRAIILSCDDRIIESIRYKIPFFSVQKHLIDVHSKNDTVTIGFYYGSSMLDDYALLKGDGKLVRHLIIQDLSYLNSIENELRYYIFQAIELDKERHVSKATS